MVDISYRDSLKLSNHKFERQPSFRGLVDYFCSDDALDLRWRRLISVFIAVTINCALLSLSVLTCSIKSTTSCGTRAVMNCDFAFLLLVAIAETSLLKCVSLYIKIMMLKLLTQVSAKTKVIHTLTNQYIEKRAPPNSILSTRRGLTKPLIEVTIMADTQSNQTRLKFTFLIASGAQRLASMSFLIFVSRQGAYHE